MEGLRGSASRAYDVTDDAPTGSTANTLFVPYFWQDEVDNNDGYTSSNDYIRDYDPARWPTGWATASTGVDPWVNREVALGTILKYNGVSPATIAESPPVTRGPNKSCPDQLLRLNNSKTTVTNKINSLSYWSHGARLPRKV
jgi:hypothetical protein